MKPLGWFQVGWSAELPPGGVKPLKYFGEDLVMFSNETGELNVLEAHCHHLGAHLGHGGIVRGDAIACPYHGWEWNGEGRNTRIPLQDNCINKKLKTWTVKEQNEAIFLWHDQAGGGPRWEIPDIFASFPDVPATADDFYPCYGQSTLLQPAEGVHPAIAMENAVDTAHFQYTHTAPISPELLDYKFDDHSWRSLVGFRSRKDGEFGLHLRAIILGVGAAFNVFAGAYNYRVLFAVTPIDESKSDLFYSVWIPRQEGIDPSTLHPAVRNQLPAALKKMVDEDILATLDEDLLIWRTQKYIERPIHARQDLRPYTELRNWQKGFYNEDEANLASTQLDDYLAAWVKKGA
jgi:phenylpropionate dioxygenase-like ring-hydroxylating dioxygenase large terminal subunit